MQTTYEQIIEAARQLSPEEIEKLGKWAREQQAARREADGKNAEVREEVRKFNLAMKWIKEHRQEYLGQWVCLDGERLVSSGKESERVYEEALKQGIKAPFLEFVKEEETHYMGGWEACRQV